MKVIDSHVHFWNPDHLQYDWLAEVGAINRPYLPSDFNEASADVDVRGIVFVQANCIAKQALDELHWVNTLDAPIRAIVAFAPLEQGAKAQKFIEELATVPNVRGVRRLIQSEERGFANHPSFIEGVQLLEAYGLSFDICIYHHQLPDVLDLLKHCPNTRFVLDHGGKPDIKSGLLDPWREQIKQLADFNNVSCKISGLVTEADHDNWTTEHLKPYVEYLLETFGADRLMFGSDYPVLTLAGQYRQWWQTIQSLTQTLSADERQAIYFDTAKEFYRITDEI